MASQDSLHSPPHQTNQFLFTQSHYRVLLERAIRVEEETKRVHEHIAQLREDSSKETAQLRKDMITEITQLRKEMTAEITQVREDSSKETAQLRKDMMAEITQLRK